MHLRLNIICSILILASLSVIQADSLTGAWRGELQLGQAKLPLVFNFAKDSTGTTLCALDSPSQGAKGIPAEVILCTSDSISLTCNAIGASYNGTVLPASVKGTFRQRGYSFPLELAPEIPVEERRPQTPRPPYPYSAIDTTFTSSDGAVMSVTLTLPPQSGNNKIPAIIMVTGSGPQNRDEEILEHKPFAVIADHLARNGIASLRYDDRGTGKSTGDFMKATTVTFKDDAKSAIAFLRATDSVGPVGVLGHSEGGTIAFMLGAENLPDFIISLAGMAISGKETLMSQNSHALDRTGFSDEEKANSLNLIGRVFDAMAEQNISGTSKPINIDSIASASGLKVHPQILSSLKMTRRTPWFDAFISLNPRQYLKDVKCPIIAINGNNDTQVDGTANLSVIRELVPQAEIRLMPQLNHLMQHSLTGEASEYGEINETISPEVLEIITEFIKRQ